MLAEESLEGTGGGSGEVGVRASLVGGSGGRDEVVLGVPADDSRAW